MRAARTTMTLRIKAGAALACATVLALALAGGATAKIVNTHKYNGVYPAGSFDGTGSVGGPAPFTGNLHDLGINQETGQVFLGDANDGLIYKFSDTGTPEAYSALGGNTVLPQSLNNWGDVFVDNGTNPATKGRIYGFGENQPVGAYLASGAAVPEWPKSLGPVCGGDAAPDGTLWLALWSEDKVQQFDTTTGNAIGTGFSTPTPCDLAIDGAGNFYTVSYGDGRVRKYNSAGVLQAVIDEKPGGEPELGIDRSNNHVFVDRQEKVYEYDAAGGLVDEFGSGEGGYPGLAGSRGIAVNQTTHRVYVDNENGGPKIDTFIPTGNVTVPDVTSNPPSVTATTATLKGTVDIDSPNGGTAITNCHFEWGQSQSYGEITPCDQATPINGQMEVTATITGLTTAHVYHFRATATNANGVQSNGGDVIFEPAGPPQITEEKVSDVNTDGATISAHLAPGGAIAKYHIEFGTTNAYGTVQPIPDAESPDNITPFSFKEALTGLSPGTTYHYRITAENGNEAGPQHTADHTFTTFPLNPSGPDPCPNAQVRQQTGASLLLDCRAYELASAPDTGGYDVQSDLIPGQVTLTPQPGAPDRVLYSVHFGTIPGTGEPTNLGEDPYVASRGSNGWNTSYVGINASEPPANPAPFGSPLDDSSSGLSTFAFGGEDLCDPCFSDGSSGIPVRMPNGTLVQGMKGKLNPGPGAEPAGYIGKALSADGTHLVFGSTSKFEEDALSGGPNISVYDRNLSTGVTHVVSKTPAGATMNESGIGELDVSDNGSRVLLGKMISTDAAGNHYWHLYMNVGDSSSTIDLTPGTTSGVLFDGMTGDGTKVFFTTPDKLGGGDTDNSADLYRADVTASSSALTKITTTNSDACSPVPGKEGPHWNSVSGAANCDAIGIAGGSGVASGDGTVFFLSPEALSGSAVANAANLFVDRPGGSPQYVATVEPTGTLVRDSVFDNEVHRFTDFQVTASGNDAAFSSNLPLTGFSSQGHFEVFRYDTAGNTLDCVSCATTGAASTGDATLANGLNVIEDGTVFFTSTEPLVLRDTNGKKDVYEWKKGVQQLVSTGISDFDSGLLSATADGANVYFYTRATLAPQDRNGNLIKIYDARRDGGFLSLGTTPLCAAADECHGPGTQPAPQPQIGTYKGEGGNVSKKKCPKGKVRKHGKCVNKHKKKCPKGKVRKHGKCVNKHKKKKHHKNGGKR